MNGFNSRKEPSKVIEELPHITVTSTQNKPILVARVAYDDVYPANSRTTKIQHDDKRPIILFYYGDKRTIQDDIPYETYSLIGSYFEETIQKIASENNGLALEDTPGNYLSVNALTIQRIVTELCKKNEETAK